MSTYTLKYATTRGEVWRGYWRAWAKPAGLWRHHVVCGAAAAFAAALVNGLDWLSSAVLGLAVTLCCIALLPLWPQIRFKPQVRTLEVDEFGYRTSIGHLKGSRRWLEIRSVRDEDNTVVITTRNGSAMLIPQRAFDEGIDRERFVTDIEAWHKHAGEPTRSPHPTRRGAANRLLPVPRVLLAITAVGFLIWLQWDRVSVREYHMNVALDGSAPWGNVGSESGIGISPTVLYRKVGESYCYTAFQLPSLRDRLEREHKSRVVVEYNVFTNFGKLAEYTLRSVDGVPLALGSRIIQNTHEFGGQILLSRDEALACP